MAVALLTAILIVLAVLAVLLALAVAALHHQPEPCRNVAGITLFASREGVTPMQLKDNEKVAYAVIEEDAAGNAVNGDVGTAEWSVDNGDIVALDVDGFSAVARALGPVGTATVSVVVTIPVDGTDPRVYNATDAIVVVGSDDVTQIALQAGTPEPQ